MTSRSQRQLSWISPFGTNDLVEPLRAAFVVHQCAAGFGEGGGGQDQFGVGRCCDSRGDRSQSRAGPRRRSAFNRSGVGAAEKVVFQDDDRFDLALSGSPATASSSSPPADESQTGTVAFGHHEEQLSRAILAAQGPRHIGRGAAKSTRCRSRSPKPPAAVPRSSRRRRCWSANCARRSVADRPAPARGIEGVGHGESEPSEIVRCGMKGLRGGVIEAGGVRGGDEQRALCAPAWLRARRRRSRAGSSSWRRICRLRAEWTVARPAPASGAVFITSSPRTSTASQRFDLAQRRRPGRAAREECPGRLRPGGNH